MRVATAPAFTGHDQYLFREGTHARLYEKLGAHLLKEGGTRFAVWAPNARRSPWIDAQWMQSRKRLNALDAPFSVYEARAIVRQPPAGRLSEKKVAASRSGFFLAAAAAGDAAGWSRQAARYPQRTRAAARARRPARYVSRGSPG
jgi:hypothetical protein